MGTIRFYYAYRLRLKVQQEVDWCRDTKQILKWQEVVEDLWNVHFPYLKKELLGVGKYPFMEIGVISGEIDEQGIFTIVLKFIGGA